MTIFRAKADNAEVGKTADLAGLTINGETVDLKAGTYSYEFDSKGEKSLAITAVSESSSNIYVSNQRTSSGTVVNIPSVEKTRIIVQEDKKEPVIYIITIKGAVSNNDDANLETLVLTPGDDSKTPEDAYPIKN